MSTVTPTGTEPDPVVTSEPVDPPTPVPEPATPPPAPPSPAQTLSQRLADVEAKRASYESALAVSESAVQTVVIAQEASERANAAQLASRVDLDAAIDGMTAALNELR